MPRMTSATSDRPKKDALQLLHSLAVSSKVWHWNDVSVMTYDDWLHCCRLLKTFYILYTCIYILWNRTALKKRPPYWNSLSGFYFDLFIVIGMSFCIDLPNFVQIESNPAELWRRVDFYRAALNAGRSSQEKAVCLSVCQTRALWQNGRKFCPDFYTIRKII